MAQAAGKQTSLANGVDLPGAASTINLHSASITRSCKVRKKAARYEPASTSQPNHRGVCIKLGEVQ